MEGWSGIRLLCAASALAWLCACGPTTGTPGIDPPGTRGRGLSGGAGAGTGTDKGSSGPERDAGHYSTNPPPATSSGSGGRSAVSSGTGGSTSGNSFGNAGSAANPGTGTMDAGAHTPSEDLDGGVEGDTNDAWFVGFWVVDQPDHALYEATLYELVAGGRLAQHETYTLGGVGPDFVTGTVTNADGVMCSIKGFWAAPAARTLGLESSCSDGTAREIVLVFPEADPSGAMRPTIMSVGGETSGWEHKGFAWSWRKCPDRGNCNPF